MANSIRVLFTALPNGRDQQGIRLSIFVSPRLEGVAPGLLADYPALLNWPAQVKRLRGSLGARLRLGKNPTATAMVPLELTSAYLDGLDEKLWEQALPLDRTPVQPRQFQDHAQRWIRSFDARQVSGYLDSLYDQVAAAGPRRFPDLKGKNPLSELALSMDQLIDAIRPALPPPSREGHAAGYQPIPAIGPATHPDRDLETNLDQLQASLKTAVPLKEMFRAYRFYRRGNQRPYYSKEAPRDLSQISDPPEEPRFDFHDAISALGDHPAILRKLGLIIDTYVLDPGALGNYDQLEIVLSEPLPGLTVLLPWTEYDMPEFRARPAAQSDLQDGMLRLDDEQAFTVGQLDTDGSVLKLIEYGVNMGEQRKMLEVQAHQHPNAQSTKQPAETSLPALRNGGLAVVRSGRDDALWAHLKRVQEIEGHEAEAVLTADDLLRGFRVDVNYLGSWHSLCRRSATFEIVRGGAVLRTVELPGPDEGYVKAASASSDPGVSPAQNPDLYLHETLFAWNNWSLVAPSPQQTLSFEHQPDKHQIHKMEPVKNRAGGGLPIAINSKAEPLSLPPLRIGQSYRLRARAVDLAGNGVAPPPSKRFPHPTVDEAGDRHATAAVSYLRLDPVPAPALIQVTPPMPGESAETLVIRRRSTYGLLPGQTPKPLPPELGIDEQVWFSGDNARWLAPPKCSVGTAEQHGVFDHLFQNPKAAFAILKRESGSWNDAVPGAKLYGPTGEVPFPAGYDPTQPMPANHTVLHTEVSVLLPYLPDPLARGVAFLSSVGPPDSRKFASNGVWPDAQPFRFTLTDGNGPAVLEVTAGAQAWARLPRGTMLAVNVASAIVPTDAASEGELVKMARYARMSAASKAETRAYGWQHWMLTPGRILHLVNAVERPLQHPIVTDLSQQRQPGDTFAELRCICENHAASTGELELCAAWNEFLDLSQDPGPRIEPRKGHVLDRKVDYREKAALIPAKGAAPCRHEFADTKHRKVRYRGIATTRYREYFPSALTDRKELITVSGPEALLTIPSSTRPEPPRVLYVVPTFEWMDGPGATRQRRGRGLRIYLDRPWYSSGEGELLGIVLPPERGELSEKGQELVSRWGADPTLDRKGPEEPLGPKHFFWDADQNDAEPIGPGDGLLLAERNERVSVLGFVPHYATDRKLWYVDIQLGRPDTFYTFVRLVLCRYQPDSLKDVEISPVVRAGFAQLLGDRSASLQFTPQSIDITVSGPAARSRLGQNWNVAAGRLPHPPIPGPLHQPRQWVNEYAGSGRMVTATIEQRPRGSGGELGWHPLESETLLTPHTSMGDLDTVSWQGSLRWPRPDAPPNHEHRLILRELEVFYTDPAFAELLPDGINQDGQPARTRLVYFDVFPLG